MNNYTKHFCSFKFAKKLKSLGVKQKGFWSWCLQQGKKGEKRKHLLILGSSNNPWVKGPDCEIFSAFTVTELGELLPPLSKSWYLKTSKGKLEWTCEVIRGCGAGPVYEITKEKTEVDARAQMLIYLIENKKI